MFGYPIAQVQKVFTALVGALIILAYLFIAKVPDGLEEAVPIVIAQLFGVIGVFYAKNASADDIEKALKQLASGVLALIALFTQVDVSTGTAVFSIIAQLSLAYAVYRIPNTGQPAVPRPSAGPTPAR